METMAPLQTLLWLMLLQLDNTSPVKSSDVQTSMYKSIFLPVTAGQNATLNCFTIKDEGAKLHWFKQTIKNTQSMGFSYYGKTTFYNEFSNNPRFAVDNIKNQNNLEITNVRLSDSAVYHCISIVSQQIEFLSTVHVIVKELNPRFQIEQRDLDTAEPGRSLRLNCSVHFESCNGQHRVYWFRQSEESATGVLYSHGGGSSDQCERNPDAPTNSCIYSLNMSSEQTGIYYCAVAACGQVLFGNGIKVKTGSSATVNPVVAVLSVALAATSVLVVLLAYSLCRLNMKYKRLNIAAISEDNGPLPTGNAEDSLHYAALNVKTKSRRPRNTAPTDCVYSDVR